MSAPSTGTVVVAVDDLRADAKSWSQAADAHAAVVAWMTAAAFDRIEFGPVQRLQDDFERARALLMAAVSDGGRAATTISRALEVAADAYLLDELENVHAAKQIW
jgi:hypothetical protein